MNTKMDAIMEKLTSHSEQPQTMNERINQSTRNSSTDDIQHDSTESTVMTNEPHSSVVDARSPAPLGKALEISCSRRLSQAGLLHTIPEDDKLHSSHSISQIIGGIKGQWELARSGLQTRMVIQGF
jgi:hypothetical protein